MFTRSLPQGDPKVTESFAHEICYISKEIRGPVFYYSDKEQFFAKL